MYIVILYVKSNFYYEMMRMQLIHFIEKENQINSQLMHYIEKRD